MKQFRRRITDGGLPVQREGQDAFRTLPHAVLGVHIVLEALASLELGLGARLDRHRFAGARVAAGRSLALGRRERAEADKTNFIAAYLARRRAPVAPQTAQCLLERAGESGEQEYPMTADFPVLPGDTIRFGERYF